jgi:hypothetical protein
MLEDGRARKVRYPPGFDNPTSVTRKLAPAGDGTVQQFSKPREFAENLRASRRLCQRILQFAKSRLLTKLLRLAQLSRPRRMAEFVS